MADRPTLEQVQARSARNRAAWIDPKRIGDRGVAKPARKPQESTPDKPAGRKRRGVDYEETLAHALMSNTFGLTRFERQYLFAPNRKYRADFFFPDHNLIVEIEGQAHAIKGRWKDGIARDQVIFGLGFRLLKIGTWQVRSGEAVGLIERAIRRSHIAVDPLIWGPIRPT